MAEMNRNLESAILLDESYLRFTDTLKIATAKIHRNTEDASGFLLDNPSQETIALIRQLCEKMNRLADSSQEAVKSHHRKAQATLTAYKTLL